MDLPLEHQAEYKCDGRTQQRKEARCAPDGALHGAAVAHSLHNVACAGLALGADHGGALSNAAQRLTKVTAAAHKGHLEVVLVDVMHLVRGREHLGLVDVVHAEALEDLRLHEVADARLGHDGDGDGLLDGRDHGGIGHARDAAVPARRRGVCRGHWGTRRAVLPRPDTCLARHGNRRHAQRRSTPRWK